MVMRVVISTPIGEDFIPTLDLLPNYPVWKLKKKICHYKGLSQEEVCFFLRGNLVNEDRTLGDLEIGDDALVLMPKEIKAGVDEFALAEEYRFLRSQFPLVRMEDLMTYKGKLRCERGPVKELADRGVWPFTEYVKWHEFKLVLSYLHPYKPPTATWLTDITHPNIIPKKKGKVCVSVLGKKWRPNTKLAAVINALYFLLSDPNPYSAYPTKKCQNVAKICRMYGFPKYRKGPHVITTVRRR